ncbi:MAG: UDP-N-acetylmuramate--L-alanine ligase [Acidimicrobiales bacterium]
MAEDLFDLGAARAVHIVGAGGSGMSAIATVLAAMGKRVTGSDLKDSAALRRLAAAGVEVRVGHRSENVGNVDAVAISTAVPPTNPEVVAATTRGIRVLRRADLLAAICATRHTVAVAGTHGKTTTSSMLAMILVEAGLHPSFLVGGDLNDVGGGAVWDPDHPGSPFVVEADESDGTFLELGARDVIVTNVEADHLDHWGDFANLSAGFARFVTAARGVSLVGIDDRGGAELARSTGATTFGSSETADWRLLAARPARSGSHLLVAHHGDTVAEMDLAVPGMHNARNALAAIAMAAELGAPVEAAVRALERYAGVARRWQYRGEAGGVTFVDDYAHLPTEVSMATATAREGGWGRVVVVFQPHRFSRTAALWREFADAFEGTDVLVVTDVYSAGEAPRPGVSGKLIVNAVLDAHPLRRVAWLPARRDVVGYLERVLRPGDLCLTLGAGDLTSLPEELLPLLARRDLGRGPVAV